MMGLVMHTKADRLGCFEAAVNSVDRRRLSEKGVSVRTDFCENCAHYSRFSEESIKSFLIQP